MIITDPNVQADQVEPGDQVLIDNDPVEVVTKDDDPLDNDYVIIRGYSHTTGDSVSYSVRYDKDTPTWAV